MTGDRLDVALVQRGFFSSRRQAQAAILEGRVFVDGERETKPGRRVAEAARLEVRGEEPRYVSRGGLKLEHALREFALDVRGCVCLDLGASTGGFTDCLLQHGAGAVYAVDVGYGQLAWKLRQDPRVRVLERTNARHLTREHVPEPVDFVTADLSFIGLEKVLPVIAPLCKPDARAVVLVKPQFEAGPDLVGKRGVVRDPAVHEAVLLRVIEDAPRWGFTPTDLTYSPVKGAEGNIEFLLALRRAESLPSTVHSSPSTVHSSPSQESWAHRVRSVVEEAHARLASPATPQG